jgi:hypothetical protein
MDIGLVFFWKELLPENFSYYISEMPISIPWLLLSSRTSNAIEMLNKLTGQDESRYPLSGAAFPRRSRMDFHLTQENKQLSSQA